MKFDSFIRGVLLLCVLLLMAPFAVGSDETAKQQRNKINELLETYREKRRPINLGLLREVIQKSNEYGAEAFENDKKQECYEFYRTSVQDLMDLKNDGLETSEEAEKALAILERSSSRASTESSANDRAWTMRYGFDRVMKMHKLHMLNANTLMGLGKKYYQQSQFWASQDAFAEMMRHLEETAGSSRTDLPKKLRSGPFFYGHALFARQDFEQAGEALKKAHKYIPKWYKYASRVKRRENFPDPSRYDQILNTLKKRIENNDQPGLRFLLGYEYFMTEKRKKARKQFEALDPDGPYGDPAASYLEKLKETSSEDDSGERKSF